MNNHKLHTFAIIAYKNSPYLQECIRSLIRQSFKSNIIITTSTPTTYINKIAKKYDLPLIVNRFRRDIATDWNFAFDICRSKYLTLAHQDDIYLPDYTERCVYYAEKYPDNVILFTDYEEISDSGVVENNFNVFLKRIILKSIYILKHELKSSLFKKILIAFGNPIPCPTVMYNKEKIGDFYFSHNFKINLDWEAWYRLSSIKGSFIFVNKPLLYHRIHEDSENIKGIKNNIRAVEDEIIFKTIWPSMIAKILLKLYRLSYKMRV